MIVGPAASARTLLARVLASRLFYVTFAPGEDEGLRKCAAVKPDLIVLDDSEKALDWAGFCRRLAQHPLLQTIPVLIVGPEGAIPEAAEAALEAGADDYLSRPFEALELILRSERLTLPQRQRRRT